MLSSWFFCFSSGVRGLWRRSSMDFFHSSLFTALMFAAIRNKTSLILFQRRTNSVGDISLVGQWRWLHFDNILFVLNLFPGCDMYFGNPSHPSGGGVRLQIFLHNLKIDVMSKFFDLPYSPVDGYGQSHSGLESFALRSSVCTTGSLSFKGR